jgi:uncharacterized protein
MSTILEMARNGEPLPFEIIDMHGHLGRYNFPIADHSPGSMVDVMDRIGVNKIICSHMQCMSTSIEFGNDEVYDAMTAYPGRIHGYVVLFPWSREAVKSEVEKRIQQGFSGIKLHSSNGFSYDVDAYHAGYEIADDLCLPILFHTWGQEDCLNELRAISKRYPHANLLAAHAGAANEAGYIELANECPNVYLDLAFSGSYRGLVQRFADAVNPEQIVWGSDAYFFGQGHQLGKVVGANVSDEIKKMILGENAARIMSKIREV